MKLPLGLLLEECLSKYGFRPDLNKTVEWVKGVRPLEPNTPLQNTILYIALRSCDFQFTQEQTEGEYVHTNQPGISAAADEAFAACSVSSVSSFRKRIVVIGHSDIHLPEELFRVITVPDDCDLFQLHVQIQDLFSEFYDWYMRIADAGSFGCHLQELLNLTECMTPSHIYVADMSFRILAYTDKKIMPEISATWRYQLAHGYLPVHVMKGMIDTKEFETLNGFHQAKHFYSQNFYVPFVTKNIFYKNRPQAHLFVVDAILRPNFRDIAVAQLLGEFIEMHYFILEEFKLNCNVSNHEAFFGDVMRGVCTDETVIAHQISLFGWHMNDSYRMAVIQGKSWEDSLGKVIMYHLEENPKLKCFLFEGNLVVLQNRPLPKKDGLEQQLKQLSSHYSLEICLGHSYTGFQKAEIQYRLLTRIMYIARRYQNTERFYEASDYSLLYIIDQLAGSPELNSLINRDALLLKKYDAENDTEYFAMYLSYLIHDRNAAHTSKALHVHRNTLTYRLEKIHELISLDENKYEQKILMMLSMLLLRHNDILAEDGSVSFRPVSR